MPLAGLRTDAYSYGGLTVGGANRLADVITQDSAGAVTGVREFGYNANGSTTSRTTRGSIGGAITGENHLAYSYRELTRQYIDGAPTSSARKDWRYRYSPGGEREQKRLYYGPNGDENGNVYPWIYYLLGGAKEQRAVYHGQQTRGLLCSDTGTAVYFYPYEYITTGLGYTGVPEAISPLVTSPDGSKRYRISDHLASLRVEIGPSGTGHYDYDPWGKLTAFTGAVQSRSTFNDQEQDPESGNYDLSARQYDPSGPVIESADPLWEHNPGESPYVYCSNNPLRRTDPTGMQSSVLQVPYDEGGEGVPTGGVNMYEAYIANHPEVASEMAYEEKWAGKSESAEGTAAREGTTTEEPSGKSSEGKTEGQTKMEKVREAGKAGEKASGVVKNTEKIEVRQSDGSMRSRVPDGLDKEAGKIQEVKNVAKQGLTGQIKDYIKYAQQEGYTFDLFLREGATQSKPLQDAAARGEVLIRYFTVGSK